MPMYTYFCAACHHVGDELHPSGETLTECPKCETESYERQFPRGIKAKTDREYFRGRGSLADQFGGNEKTLLKRISAARKHGYNPSPNDVYEPSMARFPGDPQAFIGATGGRGQIKKYCERNNITTEGGDSSVRHIGSERPAPAPVKLAGEVVEEIRQERILANPDLAHTDQMKMREEIIHTHGNPEVEV